MVRFEKIPPALSMMRREATFVSSHVTSTRAIPKLAVVFEAALHHPMTDALLAKFRQYGITNVTALCSS